MRRRNEVVLHKPHLAVVRVVERSGAAFAGQDLVVVPEAGEVGAFAQEGVYERLAGWGGLLVGGFGAEFGGQALGAGYPSEKGRLPGFWRLGQALGSVT